LERPINHKEFEEIYFNNGTAGRLSINVEQMMKESIQDQTSRGRIDPQYYISLVLEKQNIFVRSVPNPHAVRIAAIKRE
jgi:hypothetical protein